MYCGSGRAWLGGGLVGSARDWRRRGGEGGERVTGGGGEEALLLMLS